MEFTEVYATNSQHATVCLLRNCLRVCSQWPARALTCVSFIAFEVCGDGKAHRSGDFQPPERTTVGG